MKRLANFIKRLFGYIKPREIYFELLSIRLLTPNHIIYEFNYNDIDYFFYDVGVYDDAYERHGISELTENKWFEEESVLNYIMSKRNKWIRRDGVPSQDSKDMK